MWEDVVGASLWISVDFHEISMIFLHVDLHFLSNSIHLGSGNYFLGCFPNDSAWIYIEEPKKYLKQFKNNKNYYGHIADLSLV